MTKAQDIERLNKRIRELEANNKAQEETIRRNEEIIKQKKEIINRHEETIRRNEECEQENKLKEKLGDIKKTQKEITETPELIEQTTYQELTKELFLQKAKGNTYKKKNKNKKIATNPEKIKTSKDCDNKQASKDCAENYMQIAKSQSIGDLKQLAEQIRKFTLHDLREPSILTESQDSKTIDDKAMTQYEDLNSIVNYIGQCKDFPSNQT
jgi:hypothetical protein